MFFFSTSRARNVCANRTFIQAVVYLSVLCGVLALTGCGASGPKTTSGGASPSSSSSSNLTISTSLPAGTVGTSYSATVAVAGGAAPYTFTLASGELPKGLNLGDSSGTISGMPSASGNSSFTISVSDSNGVSKQQPLQITVASAASNGPESPSNPPSGSPSNQGNSLSGVQHDGGWSSYGQQGPNWVDCSPSPCEGISFSMTQNVSSPSLSGEATAYYVGGSVPYSDALFTNQLIGTNSSQGLPDSNQTLVPSLHSFTYDVYFYGSNFGVTQALEFDINQFFNNLGFIFGHECRIAAGNEWDVWDNQNQRWTPTGISCYPNQNSWNHLTIRAQRNSNNELVYQSITLNGQTNTLNWTFPAGSAPGWYGITINYQMDGDANQDGYTTYLDNLTFSYQ
jgi:hypothetical protein